MDLSLVIAIVCGLLAVALVVLFVVFGRSQAQFRMDIGGSTPRASGGSDNSTEKTLSSRLVGLGVFVGGVFATLLARLWSMQLVSSDEYAEQAESNRTSVVYTQAPRGRILDRNGREIVTNRPSLTVVASSEVLEDEVEVRLLGNLIGMPAQAVRRKVQDTSEGSQSLRTVSVDVSRRVVAFIGEHPEAFPGVSVQQRTQRAYPNGSLAAHVVGYTGAVTADQIKASQEQQGEGKTATSWASPAWSSCTRASCRASVASRPSTSTPTARSSTTPRASSPRAAPTSSSPSTPTSSAPPRSRSCAS